MRSEYLNLDSWKMFDRSLVFVGQVKSTDEEIHNFYVFNFVHTLVTWTDSSLLQDGRRLPDALTVVIGIIEPEYPGSHSANTSVCISIADLVFRGGFLGKVTIVAELPTKTEFWRGLCKGCTGSATQCTLNLENVRC